MAAPGSRRGWSPRAAWLIAVLACGAAARLLGSSPFFVYLASHRRGERHPRGVAEHRERDDRAVLHRPRRLHGGGRVHRGQVSRSRSRTWRSPACRRRSRDQLLLRGALLAGGIAAALCGFMVGLPSLRLRGRLPGHRDARASGRSSASSCRTPRRSARALGLSGIPQRSTLRHGLVLGLPGGAGGAAHRRLARTAASCWAIREDEVAAEAMGVEHHRATRSARSSSPRSSPAWRAGCSPTSCRSSTPARFTFVKSMEVVVMVVAGGLGSTTGAIVAAVFLTLLPEALRTLFMHVGGGEPRWRRRSIRSACRSTACCWWC